MYYAVIGAAALMILLLILRGIHENKKALTKLKEKLISSYGKKGMRDIEHEDLNCLKRYHLNTLSGYEGGQVIDDITWNDLDMDKVFLSVDRSLSQTGSEYLYDMLKKPVKDSEEIKERDRVIEHFDTDSEKRLEFQATFASMGKMKRVSVSDHLLRLGDVSDDSNLRHYLCVLLGILAVGSIFVSPGYGFLLFFTVLVFNVATYFKRKGQIEPYIVSFAYLIRSMGAAQTLIKLKDEEVSEYTGRLSYILASLKGLNTNTFILLSGRGMTGGFLDMFLDYIRIFFHLDLIKFNNMLAIVRSKNSRIFEMFEVMGFLESCISIASFRRSLPVFCIPEHTGIVGFKADGLCHPLLNEPVPSDIDTVNGVLITGSNASGKSTFLKSVAVSVLLSQTIATAVCAYYKAPFFDIYSSMSLRDDILAGESYYMAEIKSLKRILDKTDENKAPVICFIDEVLRGTNTIERIAASSQILKNLSMKNVLLFAATHDIELTFMLEEYLDNYHFSEEILENDIRFSYKLMTGRAQSKNAIKLLSLLGYDDEITQAAQRLTESFTRNNKWEKA
ncbi:MAG: hypothetical protein J6P45_06885 [Lachnospiraceae bacterium]|nr:hypothetical protein [Lachnospiraceae bacterium]